MNHSINKQDMQPGTGTPWVELSISWTLSLILSPFTLIPMIASCVASLLAAYKSFLDIRDRNKKK